MSQHNLRRSLAAFAFAFATLAPFADLHAAPGRPGRAESRDEARSARRLDFSIWKPLQQLLEKAGLRIDGNGLTFVVPVEEEAAGEKAGLRIDGNG